MPSWRNWQAIRIALWREALRADLDNGRAAVEAALAHDAEAAIAIAAVLARGMSGNLYRERMTLWDAIEPLIDAEHHDQGEPQQDTQRDIQPDALRAAQPFAPALAARAAYESAGHWMLTRPKRALTLAERALALFRAQGDRCGVYKALARIAPLSARLGDLAAARRAVEQMRSSEDPAWPPIVRVLGAETQAHVALDCGDDNGALHYLRMELDLERAAGFRPRPANRARRARRRQGRGGIRSVESGRGGAGRGGHR